MMKVEWDATWLPDPKRGKPRKVERVAASQAVRVIADGLHEYSESVYAECKAILNETASEIQGEAQQNVSVYLGPLKQSIGIRAESEFTRTVYAGGSAAPYAPYVEYGTSSGAPTIETILDWMDKKGIQPRAGQTEEEAAYNIRGKIRFRGIRAHPFFFPAFIAQGKAFAERIRGVLR